MRKLYIVAFIGLTGCATILSGTSQTINLTTNPEGADCYISSNHHILGNVQTPGSIVVDRTKYDLRIHCVKSGYASTDAVDKSGSESSGHWNSALGGAIGLAIDSSTGADNEYTTPFNVNLIK